MAKKNKIYFGEFEEEQFLKFINEDNDFERNKIYSRYLHEPFKRMINLILKSFSKSASKLLFSLCLVIERILSTN